MPITLSDGTTTLELPEDLQWSDEFGWTPVEHSTDFSLSGSLVVQEGTRQDGRPITLVGGQEGSWAKRSLVEALHAMASEPDQLMTLDLWGRQFSVMFRRPAIEAREIIRQADPGPDHWYAITINLLEINP